MPFESLYGSTACVNAARWLVRSMPYDILYRERCTAACTVSAVQSLVPRVLYDSLHGERRTKACAANGSLYHECRRATRNGQHWQKTHLEFESAGPVLEKLPPDLVNPITVQQSTFKPWAVSPASVSGIFRTAT